MSIKLKQASKVFWTVLGITVVTTIFRGWLGLLIEDVAISFILYFLTSCFFIKRLHYSGKETIIYFLASLVVLLLIAAAIDGQWPSIGLPDTQFEIAGVVFGSLIAGNMTRKILTIPLAVLFACATIWYVIDGNKYWTNYIFHDSLTGATNRQSNVKWLTYTEAGDTFRSVNFTDKYVVLDFWTTSCIICRKQFPNFEALSQKYKNSATIFFQSMNVPLMTDTQGMAAIISRKYNFKKTFTDSLTTKQLGINGYPVYIVIKNDTILYKGMHIKQLERFLESET